MANPYPYGGGGGGWTPPLENLPMNPDIRDELQGKPPPPQQPAPQQPAPYAYTQERINATPGNMETGVPGSSNLGIPSLAQQGAYEDWYQRNRGSLSGPTEASSWWGQNQSQFDPSQSQSGQYWQGVQGRFNQGPQGGGQAADYFSQTRGAYAPQGGQNYAAEQYRAMQGGQGDNLDAYYDNAFRKANERINQSAAASGMLGSSSTAGLVSEAATNLAAQQAMDRANFDMQRQQQLLQGAQAAGSQDIAQRGVDLRGLALGQQGASMASAQDLQRDRLGLDYLLGGASAAGAADQAGLSRLLAGGDYARSVDDQEMERVLAEAGLAGKDQDYATGRAQDFFAQNLATTQLAMQALAPLFQEYMNTDLGLTGDSMTAGSAAGTAGIQGEQAKSNAWNNFLAQLGKAGKAIKTSGLF